jgi:hypothetical protein
MFTFTAFVALLYNETHHPNLLLLMVVTTIIISSGVWFFLRFSKLIGRVLSIVASFFAGTVPMAISYLTWNWRAYFEMPQSDYWYDNLGVAPIGVIFWLLILFCPALIALIQRIVTRRIA